MSESSRGQNSTVGSPMGRAFYVVRLVALAAGGILSGLYTIGAAVLLIQSVMTHDLRTAGGAAQLAASVAGTTGFWPQLVMLLWIRSGTRILS